VKCWTRFSGLQHNRIGSQSPAAVYRDLAAS
jgi:hypothetical protein